MKPPKKTVAKRGPKRAPARPPRARAAKAAVTPPVVAAPVAPDLSAAALEALDRLAFYGALALTTALIAFIYSLHIPEKPATITIISGWLAPESNERRMYLAALVSFPLFFLGLRPLLGAMLAASIERRAVVLNTQLQRLNAVVLIASAAYLFRLPSRFNFWYAGTPPYADVYFQGTFLRTALWPFVGAMAAFVAAFFVPQLRALNPLARPHRDRLAALALDAFVLYLIAKLSLFGMDNYNNWVHFEAVYYAMVQVYYGGHTLLVDQINQYGLYPHFLDPIFRLWGGLTEWRFRIVLSVLMAVCWTSLWGFVRVTLRSRVLAFVGFLAVIHYTYLLRINFWDNDPYFQYFPIRFITPTLTLWLSARYFYKGEAWAYRLATALVALGMLWNLESGIISLAAWSLTLIWHELAAEGGPQSLLARAAARAGALRGHALAVGGSLLAVLALHVGFTLLRAHSLPHYLEFLNYQNLFYGQGFGMIAMVLAHPWLFLAALFATGLALSSGFLFRRSRDAGERAEHAQLLLLALVGSGFFSYFQGRSHDTNIMLGLYGPVLLALMLLDRALDQPAFERQQAEGDLGRPLIALVYALVLFAPFGYAWGYLGKISLRDRVKTQVLTAAPERFAFLRPYFQPGEQIYVMLQDQSIAYSASRTGCAYKGPGVQEMILQEDIDNLKKYLMEDVPGRKLITLGQLPNDYMNHYNVTISPKYQVDAVGVNQHPVVYTQLGPVTNTATLFDLKDQLFHCREHRQYIYTLISPDGSFYPNFDYRSGQVIKSGSSMTLELALIPPAEAGGSVLLSNRVANSGFELAPGSVAGEYVWKWGDDAGKSLAITLNREALNYVAIVVQGGVSKAYVNGTLVATKAGAPQPSGSQLLVHEKWNPWPGRILELKIGSRAKSAGEIQAVSAKVLTEGAGR